MSYYIGFLKESKKHAVVFKSIVKPKKDDLTYFLKVVGPYSSWDAAKIGLKMFRGYRENPVTNPVSQDDVREAVQLTKRVYKLYKSVRKGNPGKRYHDQHFIQYMKDLDKYVLGSAPYTATLAKAYEHLQSARDSDRESVR
jgi:hypothetical protein